ncbi:MAG TPA: hypothetical protein VNS46_09525 [Nocardioides sp.]|nr:hypothetical protein [Nocardioides sp.]
MQSEGGGKAERYSSGGLVSGVVGLVAVVAVIGFGLFSDEAGFAPWAYPALLLAGVLVWTVLLRPAIVLHADELELRNILHSRFVPFARMTSVQVKQMTVVEVGEERFVGSGFGRSRLTINRDAKAGPSAPSEQRSVGWLVEEKVRRRMMPHDGFTDLGEVRRTWAVPEIAAIVVLAVVTLVVALVA